MELSSPHYLLLVPALALLGWFFRPLGLHRPLRALLILFLVFAACDPQLRLRTGGMDLWVLFDRSLSARELVDAGESEWKTLLLRSQPSDEDRVHWIDFAAEVSKTGSRESVLYSAPRDETRTALAIRSSLAQMDPSRHHRILVFSDGYSTEPLGDVANQLVAAGVPFDYRILQPEERIDFQVGALDLPSRTQPGEPFVVDVTIKGNADGIVPLTMARNERTLFTREVELKGGKGRFRFSDRLDSAGAHLYSALIEPETDAFAGNNQFDQWIEVVAGPRVILISRYEDDPVEGALLAQGFTIERITDSLSVSPGTLTGARAVILNNVPAFELPNEFLKALDFFVAEQGGGFLMIGGKNSFGSGGYYQSPVDPLLPVTMELKSEHRRLAVAMAIVMDRSGSMAAITPSGNTKMQLANEGAARAVELLGDLDAVTVYAVDSKAHQICKLLNVGKSRSELNKRIRRIESMGGGIFVYTGMREAWSELQKANSGQRHMILFSDAADSEEPGEYQELLTEMENEGATVSVIGLGTRSDPDASFLEDIARRGSGRIFFSEIPGDLP
ncbi:MAG: VWA domain-containing protein, partial [Verrucomicrobiota bacterium]